MRNSLHILHNLATHLTTYSRHNQELTCSVSSKIFCCWSRRSPKHVKFAYRIERPVTCLIILVPHVNTVFKITRKLAPNVPDCWCFIIRNSFYLLTLADIVHEPTDVCIHAVTLPVLIFSVSLLTSALLWWWYSLCHSRLRVMLYQYRLLHYKL